MEQFLQLLSREEQQALKAAVSSRIVQLSELAKQSKFVRVRMQADAELHHVVRAAGKLGL